MCLLGVHLLRGDACFIVNSVNFGDLPAISKRANVRTTAALAKVQENYLEKRDEGSSAFAKCR